jgi:hypothetical protein
MGSYHGIDFCRAEMIVARPTPRCRRLERRPKVGATDKRFLFVRFAWAARRPSAERKGRRGRLSGTTEVDALTLNQRTDRTILIHSRLGNVPSVPIFPSPCFHGLE